MSQYEILKADPSNDQLPVNNDEFEGNLANPSEDDGLFLVYWYRWYILVQVGLLGLIQNFIAGMWSPINLSAEKAFELSPNDFDLLANWGVVGFVVFLPVALWQLDKYGMRVAVITGAVLVFVGAGIRCLPLGDYQKYAIHVAQVLNGMGGSPSTAAAPYVANVWFPVKDRIFSTGFLMLFGNLGGSMSYVLGPYLIQLPTTSNSTDNTQVIRNEIRTYMLTLCALSAIMLLMMIVYFPNKPPTPPSLKAASDRMELLAGLKVIVKNRTYWIIVIIFCGEVASFFAWMGLLSVLYTPKGVSEETAGLIGAVTTTCGVVMGICFSWLADRLKAYRSRLWIILNVVCYITSLYVVIISLQWIDVAPFKFSLVGLWSATIILGIGIYAMQPIAVDLAVDAAQPISEGTSGYVLMLVAMFANVVWFSSLSAIKNQDAAFYMMLVSTTVTLPLLHFSIHERNTQTTSTSM